MAKISGTFRTTTGLKAQPSKPAAHSAKLHSTALYALWRGAGIWFIIATTKALLFYQHNQSAETPF
jgi:hypothetical protein